MTGGGPSENHVEGAIVPDGGWGWIIVFASLMIHFIMDGITYSMGDVFLHPIKDRLGAGRGAVSTIFSILPAITLASGPIATIFTNRYGCRRVTIIGSCIAALGFLLSYFWANIWIYYLGIGVIGGLGFGLIYLPAIVSVGFYFEKRRSFAMGIAVCGSGLGTLVFPWIMDFIINHPFWFDYDGALLLESAIIFICIIFGALMIPLPQEPSEIRRLERKSRLKSKMNNEMKTISSPSARVPIDDQQTTLISDKEKEIRLKDLSDSIPRESSAVVPAEIEENPNVVLSRKDAQYQGDLQNIPMFNENPSEYHRQMIRTTDEQTIEEIKKSFFTQIAEQIDLKLLEDLAFALFAVSNFLTSLGFNVPYNFANDLATDAKVPEHQRKMIIMSIGISNCFGRVVIGFLADRKINRLFLYNFTLIIAGLATMGAPYCNEHVWTHIIYASLFGFFSGGYVGLTSIIVVDLVGVNKLSDAFGVLLLFQGIAVAIGTPIVGTMRDLFEHFDRPYLWPYLIFGGSILLSGLILFAIPPLRKYAESKHELTRQQIQLGVHSYSKQNLSSPSEEKQQI